MIKRKRKKKEDYKIQTEKESQEKGYPVVPPEHIRSIYEIFNEYKVPYNIKNECETIYPVNILGISKFLISFRTRMPESYNHPGNHREFKYDYNKMMFLLFEWMGNIFKNRSMTGFFSEQTNIDVEEDITFCKIKYKSYFDFDFTYDFSNNMIIDGNEIDSRTIEQIEYNITDFHIYSSRTLLYRYNNPDAYHLNGKPWEITINENYHNLSTIFTEETIKEFIRNVMETIKKTSK